MMILILQNHCLKINEEKDTDIREFRNFRQNLVKQLKVKYKVLHNGIKKIDLT